MSSSRCPAGTVTRFDLDFDKEGAKLAKILNDRNLCEANVWMLAAAVDRHTVDKHLGKLFAAELFNRLSR